MKIRIVKPILPYPPTQGTRRVTLNLIDALRVDHEVTVLCKTLSDDEERLVPELAARCKVISVRAPNTKSFLHRVGYKILYLARALFTLLPLREQYDCPRAVLRAARRLLASERFDLLLVEYWTMAEVALRGSARVKCLLEHDFDTLRNKERVDSLRNPLRRIPAWWAWRLEKRRQLAAYGRFDWVLTLTEFDKRLVQEAVAGQRKHSGSRAPAVRVLPTGVDDSLFDEQPGPVEAGSVLFVGAFAADFNVDALRYLVDRIFPLVRRELPDAKLYVAGGDESGMARKLCDVEGVVYLGLLEDLRGVLRRTAAFVVPLRFAGGIRIRILEAMAMGKAVVTTGVGLRGIPAVHGEHVLVADRPEEFAAWVVKLLKDPELRASLGASARKFARANYSMEAARRRTLRLLAEMERRAE